MAVTYRVDVENSAGSTVAVFQDFLSLSFTSTISAKGDFQLSLAGFDSRISDITDDSIIRVWFTDPASGIDWINIFTGFHKTFNDSLAQNGQRTFTSYGPSAEELLDKTWILYATGSTQAVKSGAATTVMYEYVAENAGPSATAARDVTAQNVLSAAADPALGGTWDGTKPRKHLLSVLREISDFTRENNAAVADKVDFRVNYLGSAAFQFQAGALGIDRTTDGLTSGTGGQNGAGNAPVIFAAELGNILTENRSQSRYNESNVVVALGQGYGSDRRVEVATNAPSLAASPFAQRESVINAVQASSSAQLLVTAQAKLRERAADVNFSFEPRKGAEVLYRDYFLADYVTAQDFRTATRVNKQIRSIATRVSRSDTQVENISMVFEDANPA